MRPFLLDSENIQVFRDRYERLLPELEPSIRNALANEYLQLCTRKDDIKAINELRESKIYKTVIEKKPPEPKEYGPSVSFSEIIDKCIVHNDRNAQGFSNLERNVWEQLFDDLERVAIEILTRYSGLLNYANPFNR